jgi:hypothetical protein
LDSKSLGFGNTRGLTQDDLKLFSDTLKQFKNIMEGIIASCEIAKQSSDMFCEMNTNKIVLDFLRFLKRYEKSMKDITELKNDRYKVDKLATNLFGNKNKESSDMVIYRTLFEKAAHYSEHDFVPSETAIDLDSGISV